MEVTRAEAHVILIKAIMVATPAQLEDMLDAVVGGENPIVELDGACHHYWIVREAKEVVG